MRTFLCCLFFPLFTAVLWGQAAPAGASFLNVVVLIGDDHAAGVLGCYGNSLARTPNLDRLADGGVRFTHAYANAPLCSASRQSILTGRYPHAAGVTLLRTSFPDEQLTIAEHLRERGFRTGVIGKTHFNNNGSHGFETVVTGGDWRKHLQEHPPRRPPDSIATFGEWRPFRDPARIWLNADKKPQPYYEEATEGAFYAEAANAFLEKNRNERFCLWVGFHEPHSPFHFPVEHRDDFRPQDMPLPATGPGDDRWVPAIFRGLSAEDKQGIIAAYYSSVGHLDRQIGRILDKIDELGIADSTLVIYIGDQGYLLGHHKRFEKHSMWEEAIRSPFILRGGSRYGQGRVIDALTEFIDLAPTILEALGMPPMPSAQGQSLLPVLEGRTGHHKELVFSEFLADDKAVIRTHRWKYIFSSGKRDLGQGYETGFPPPGITQRLYDLARDPQELHNLAAEPAHASILAEMQQAMLRIFRATDPRSWQIDPALSVEEKLMRFCEPPDVDADLEAR